MKEIWRKKMNKFAAVLLISFIMICQAQDLKEVLDLKGTWKFMIGDDAEYAEPLYNDKDWERINVPDSWEDEGFPGFDGMAWYRYEISGKIELPKKNLILNLGRIDDVDEVFFNGKLIGGKGTFPPQYNTAYNTLRLYKIPQNLIRRKGNNVIAVRVYDEQGPGGIIRGHKIGIYESDNDFDLVYQCLEGTWKFKSGNDPEWKNPDIDDSFWNDIEVPGKWEDQGYDYYNGFGWYRKTFVIESNEPQYLILRAGQIDDFEKVYVNGFLVGKTMPRLQESFPVDQNNDWQKTREYYIPKSKINWGGKNTIAICVYDGYLDGGIINGPVEILTREEYKLREEENHYNFQEIMDMIFGN